MPQDGTAGAAGGFAIVTGAEDIAFIPKPVGVAVVAGVVVLLAQGLDDFLHLRLRFHGIGKGDEPGTVVLEKAFRGRSDTLV